MRLRKYLFLALAVLATVIGGAGICAAASATSVDAPTLPSAADTGQASLKNARNKNFDYFVTGDPTQQRAPTTQFGLALMGGGGSVDAAFRFISAHAGGGHIVILSAVSDDSVDPDAGHYNESFSHEWGPVISAETIVFHNREASFDHRVIAALRGADGIFLAGGDQGNYLRYWKGTPVQTILNAHVRANRPIGGSSAGLAILGRYSYTCYDGHSMESKEALDDPYHASITLESNFLRFRWLDNVITDSHFSARSRLGRLITFVARLHQQHSGGKIFGIGVDEKTALLVDADGKAHLAAGSAGSAWLVMPRQAATTLRRGVPLSVDDVHLTQMDTAGTLDLRTRVVQHPAATAVISLVRGRPTSASMIGPILMRPAPVPNEG